MLVPVGSPEEVAVTEASWISFVEHAIWPVAVIVLVVLLRRQIGDFLSAVGGRITQVSVMSVTIELAVATETVPPQSNVRVLARHTPKDLRRGALGCGASRVA